MTKRTSRNDSIDTESTPSNSLITSDTTTTMNEIKSLLEKNMQVLTQNYEKLDEKINNLQLTITSQYEELTNSTKTTDSKAQKALDVAQMNQTTILEESKETSRKLSDHSDEIADLKTKLNKMTSQLDDQINRGLRSTLIFSGIAQDKDETWDDTTTKLVSKLTKILPQIQEENIRAKIERAHRAKSSSNIIAKFLSWKDSELVKSALINYNNNPDNKHGKHGELFYVSQMYSKDITERRNNALKLRKELIRLNPNTSYILVYPAKLMSRPKGIKEDLKLVEEF